MVIGNESGGISPMAVPLFVDSARFRAAIGAALKQDLIATIVVSP